MDLVGRDTELQWLTARLDLARPLAVVGEAGVGKTALVRAALADRPFVEAGGLATLSWLPYLPLMRGMKLTMPERDPGEVADFVRSHLGERVLFLDDLQWVDVDTLALLPTLVPSVPVVATARAAESATPRVEQLLTELDFEVFALDGLSPDGAAALVRAHATGIDDATLERIVAGSGGNALLLEEQARTGAAVTSLRVVLRARLNSCSPAARQGLALLALLGRPSPLRLVESVLPELRTTHLVVERDQQVSIRHPLLVEPLLAALGSEVRRRLHLRLASQLPDAGEAARHYAAAGDRDQARQHALSAAAQSARPAERAAHLALAGRCATGNDADALLAQACELFQQAGDLVAATEVANAIGPENPAIAQQAALLRARSSIGAGDIEAALSLLANLEGDIGDEQFIASVAVERANALYRAGDYVAAKTHAERALQYAADATRCRAIAVLAQTRFAQGCDDWDRDLDAALKAAKATEDVGDDFVLGVALVDGLRVAHSPQALRRCVDFAGEARDAGLRAWELAFRSRRLEVGVAVDDAVATTIVEAERLLRDNGLRGVDRARTTAVLAIALSDSGNSDRGVEALRSAGALTDNVSRAWLDLATADIAFNEGRDDACRAAAAGAASGVAEPIVGERAATLLDLVDPSRSPVASRRLADRRDGLRWRWADADALITKDNEAAATALLALEDDARSSGFVALGRRIERSLRAAGVRRAKPRGKGVGPLSAREYEVMILVAAGLSSNEVAGRLGITSATVETQVRSAIIKLGATTRAQAALLAAELTP